MNSPFGVVAIGASLGGVEALRVVLAGLPRDFAAGVVVVQHRSPRFPSLLREVLERASALPVVEAATGLPLQPGVVYLAPRDRHLTVMDGGVLCLSSVAAPRVQFTRPAIDPLFASVAECYGPHAIGLVLTGRQRDGSAGAHAIKQRGGRVLVQDPRTAVAPGMPAATIQATGVDYVLGLEAIAPVLTTLVMVPGAASFFTTGPRDIERLEVAASAD